MLDSELAKGLIRAAARRVSHHQDELSRLDAVAGDGDHGVNMATALAEAEKRIDDLIETTPSQVFRATGRAFHDTVGGACRGAVRIVLRGGRRSTLHHRPSPPPKQTWWPAWRKDWPG